MNISKIKEKQTVPQKAKEKIQSAPKELLRCGLLDGTEKLRGQMRDATEGGQRQETEVERAQDIVERVENRRVYTIEGNSGDRCCQRSYPAGYYEIYGYGMLCP